MIHSNPFCSLEGYFWGLICYHNYVLVDWLKILEELQFRMSRSSGAGGQHVNKTETKVEVLFNVVESDGL
ncbi:MAG TPA: peptide chain release factor-like protein, partial [Flavobacterium sp.]|nr:peptide chain release factor-like protein [Flavobacterium sp.]